MSNNLEILRKYSEYVPQEGYSYDVKGAIISALSGELTEEQIEAKITTTRRNNPKTIKMLCEQKLATIAILEQNSGLQELQHEVDQGIKESIRLQADQQQQAIADHIVQHIGSLSSYTLIDKLSKRTNKAEYKFQMSWSPAFEDSEALEHYVIEPYGSEKGESKASTPSYPLVVEYSVFDVSHMPSALLDLALHGTMQDKYYFADELMLRKEAMHHIDTIKSFLKNAKPLQYAYTQGGKTDTTQRILSFVHNGNKVGYLLSENTPSIHTEKSLRKYMNNSIRYKVYTSLRPLKKHLQDQLPYTHEKIHAWGNIYSVLQRYKETPLKDIYGNSDHKKSFMNQIRNFSELLTHSGYTLVEQKLREYLARITGKNSAADQVVLNTLISTLDKGIYHQKEKIHTMETHLEALQLDNEF